MNKENMQKQLEQYRELYTGSEIERNLFYYQEDVEEGTEMETTYKPFSPAYDQDTAYRRAIKGLETFVTTYQSSLKQTFQEVSHYRARLTLTTNISSYNINVVKDFGIVWLVVRELKEYRILDEINLAKGYESINDARLFGALQHIVAELIVKDNVLQKINSK